MVIHMNKQPLDFDLENEKNLSDILMSLEDWVARNGGIIQEVRVDDIHVSLENETHDLEKDVSSISKIEVFTASKEQHAIETVYTLNEYVRTFLNDYLSTEGTEAYDSIMEGMRLILEGTEEIVNVLGINDLFVLDDKKKSLRKILGELAALVERYEKKYFDKEGRDTLEAYMRELPLLFPKLIKWGVVKNLDKFPMIQPDKKALYFTEIAGDYYTILTEAVELFERIAENLQLGKDAEALGDIYYITEILDEYIVLLRTVQESFEVDLEKLGTDDKKLEDLFRKITGRLKEVSEALKQGDMISVGDVLEYETKPLFERLVELLGEIKDFSFFC
ncbi:MAG: hypothetical protein JSV25_06600 [Spirochaetota bacterium]|nr:MAG: hypothetical protein JSV25_06600 [Spirochaetota bacterium]